MPLFEYDGKSPQVHRDAYVAPTASLIGDVHVAAGSSIWHGAVLRGDVQPIYIGPRTSVQDNSVIHATEGWAPTRVGADVTVGHAVILHGCHIEDRVLVGMGSILLDECTIHSDVLIGAGTLMTYRSEVASGKLVVGRPGQPKRDISDEERRAIAMSAQHYVELSARYRAQK